MRYRLPEIVMVTLLVACFTTAAAAQEAAPPLPSITPPQADSAAPRTDGWSAIGVAKWSLAAASAGTAAYGFIYNQRADDRFEQLERVCVLEPNRCGKLPDGSYTDAELERDHQEVRALDRRARRALIAGQIGVAASVVLFIVDLRNGTTPENIPYEPRRIDIAPARDGGVYLRLNVQVPLPH